MTRKLMFLLALVWVMSQQAMVMAQVGLPTDPLPIDSKVKIGKLENGLTYYIRQNAKPENRVELTLAVNAGSILEDEDQLGLAHFLEHMAFNGTTNFQKHEIIEFLESLGMQFGPEVNAYTSFDETVYGIKVPLDKPEYLDKGLLVLHDWASEISIEAEEVDKERGIIEEEWRMGQGANDRMRRKYFPVMLYNSLYADRLPIGSMDVVKNCRPEAIRRFFEDWYRPDLMAVVVVGDINPEEIEKKIIAQFSKLEMPANPRERKYFDVPDHEDTKVVVATDKEAQQTTIQLFYKHDRADLVTHEDYRNSIVRQLYNSMINTRLQEMLVQENPPFIYGFSGYNQFISNKDAYFTIAMTKPEDIRTSLFAVVKENERVRQHGFLGSELERAKKSLLKTIEKAYNERENSESDNYVREYVSHYMPPHPAIPGIEYEYELYNHYVSEIRLTEVNSLADQWLRDENRVLILLGTEKEDVVYPNEEELLGWLNEASKQTVEPYKDNMSDMPLLAKEPEAGKVEKAKKNKKLDYTTYTLSNGAKVIIKQTDFKQDEILFRAYSLGGSSVLDQKDDANAKMAADIVSESGLGNYDKVQLEKFLSDKNVSLSPYISETTEGLSGRTSPSDLETFLQLVYAHFQNPRKDETAFNSLMTRTKSAIENRNLSPENVWRDSVTVIMSGHHPRKRPMSVEMLNEVDFGRSLYVYKNRFSDPNNFVYMFVGNINTDEALPLIEKYIGGMDVLLRDETYRDMGITKPSDRKMYPVYAGAEPKSMVYTSYHSKFGYSSEELTQIDLVSKILGTRLLETIREDESGVYSIGAYPNVEHYPVSEYSILIYFGCSPDNVERLNNEVQKQIDHFIANGPTQEELDKAIKKKLRERETGIKENRFWLNTLYNFEYHGSNPKEFLKYEKKLEKVTAEEIKEAFGKFLGENIPRTTIALFPENMAQN